MGQHKISTARARRRRLRWNLRRAAGASLELLARYRALWNFRDEEKRDEIVLLRINHEELLELCDCEACNRTRELRDG